MAETTLTQIQSDDCHGVKAYVFLQTCRVKEIGPLYA